MRALGLPVLQRFSFLAPLALRVGIGVVFLVHGLSKLNNGPATAFGGMLTGLSVPAPTLIGAIVLVKIDVGIIAGMGASMPGAEIDIALLAGLVALLVMGPGRLSIDAMVGTEAKTSHEMSTR